MPYERKAGLPTESECFAKLIELLREAQSETAMLSHLSGLNQRAAVSKGWLIISEQLKHMQKVTIKLATGKLQ